MYRSLQCFASWSFSVLNFASSLGKGVCVILKGDEEFSSKVKNHYFSENERATALSNIVSVKKIVVRKDKTYEECLDLIKPKFLVLGHEFERKQTGDIRAAISKAKSSGIEVVFHSGDRNVNIASSFWRTETTSLKRPLSLTSCEFVGGVKLTLISSRHR